MMYGSFTAVIPFFDSFANPLACLLNKFYFYTCHCLHDRGSVIFLLLNSVTAMFHVAGSVTESQMGKIESLAESFGIRVSSVLITEEDPPVLSGDGPAVRSGDSLQRLAARTGGASYRVARTGRTLAMYSDLVEAMRNLIAVDTKVKLRVEDRS
jgi:hypothetical protein